MHIRRQFTVSILAHAALAGAATYQGTVREALHLEGVDSVKVSLQGGSGHAYTDHAGRFTLDAISLATDRGRVERKQLIWRASAQAIEWSRSAGPLRLEIRDARGTLVRRARAGAGVPGRLDMRMPAPGLYFVEVRAVESIFAWKWLQPPGHAGSGDQAGKKDRVFSLPGSASAKAAGIRDTLVFERKGFKTAKLAVPASASGLEMKMAREPIKLLIVDGMGNHDWVQTTKVARAILAGSGYFDVTVSTAPAANSPAAWSAWNPGFSDFEIVLMNYNSGDAYNSLRWPRDKEVQLESYVSGGGGLYILHSANNGFPQWSEYNRMIGVGWRPAGFGYAMEVSPEGQVIRIPPDAGGATGHGARGDFPIHILTPHPINKGYPRKYLSKSLEIYYYARGPAENCTVLSYAFDGPASGNTGRNWPIELLIAYGKGLVYNATPGHLWPGETVPDAVKDVSFQTTLVRASEWLARREVFYPVPEEFNSETRVALKDIVLP
jgi:hypothetical protein